MLEIYTNLLIKSKTFNLYENATTHLFDQTSRSTTQPNRITQN